MARLSDPQLIHKIATQGVKAVAKPRGLRKRGGSREMRVRVPDRFQRTIGKSEIIKSFGGVWRHSLWHIGINLPN